MLFLDKSLQLTNVEYYVYQYIINNLEKITYMRIRELAEATHVSTATIQRLCKKFECEGFSEFKIRLKLYIKEQKNNPSILLDISSQIDFFNRVSQPHFQSLIKDAAAILKDKELVIFIGVGSSNVLAKYGALYFSKLYKMAVRIENPTTDPLKHIYNAMLSKACIIALSVSGETREVIHYINEYNFDETPIISITNSSDSTIARLSNVNIPYYINKENIKKQDITSQVPALFILEYLAKVNYINK